METFYWVDCRKRKPVQTEGGTGYAILRDSDSKVCYVCVAERDRKAMVETGHGNNLPLYLSKGNDGKWKVGNWPSTLTFPLMGDGHPRKGTHNIAGTRYDVWFVGPDGYVWHGVQYGEWTQVVHAKRTKDKWQASA